MAYTPNNRTTIDQEVFKWVKQQKQKDKVVTVNLIRQKAFELGQELDPNFKASLNWYNNWKKRYNYCESPEAEALKHKKRHYTAAFKLHAVQRAAEMESASQAALELDVSRRCLQRWTEEVELISSVAEHSSNAVYRRPGQGRKVIDENLDKDLVEWVKESWKQGTNITVNMIREKAIEMSRIPGFKASLGWYMKWQKRHGIDLKEQTCSPPAGETISPLKLRLLQEGEVYSYSPSPPVPKRRKTTKKRLSYDDEALLENDEEFDRQLLTWLVERWEAGDIVTDRMVKDRAMELTTNPEFKSTKPWLMAWKRKYNISLENQTYGNEGDEEAEEIIEQSEVYDNQVVIDDPEQQGASTSSASNQQQREATSENPLTPTKEEAATALASLSADDHEATGIEIAEALQKLANAFGITTQDGAKEAMAQLTAAYQGDNPEFLLEGGEQVAVEEVISEEVVTDEPMVVIEEGVATTETTTSEITSAPVISVTTTSDNIVIETHTATTVANTNIIDTSCPSDQLQVSTTNMVVTSPSASTYVSEEVIISEPEIETTVTEVPSSVEGGEVEVLVEGESTGIVIVPSTSHDEIVQQSSITVTQSFPSIDDITVSSEPTIITEIVTTTQPQETIQISSSDETVISSVPVAVDQVTIDDVSLATLSNAPPPQEIIDIVQESITGGGVSSDEGKDHEEESDVRIFDNEFKRRVVERAKELGSVRLAAQEFSVPFRAVVKWKTEIKRCTKSLEDLEPSETGEM